MVRDDVPAGQADTPTVSTPMANVRRPSLRVAPPTRDVLPVSTDTPCRRAPVPSATGEHPCAAECASHAPGSDTSAHRAAYAGVTLGAARRLLLGMVPTVPRRPAAPAPPGPRGRSPRRATAVRAVVRERARLGRRARRVPCSCSRGCASTYWSCRPTRVARAAASGPRDRSGGPAGRPDAAAGGRGERGGAAGAARLAGVGRARPGSDRPRRGRPDHRAPRCRPGRARDAARRGPPSGCGPPSRGARWSRRCRRCRPRGGGGGAPDLVRLVDAVATECHRARLRRPATATRRPTAQPLAFS